MTSDRKLRANQQNCRASTGPKTAAGKARAAKNARRHGLRVPVLSDPVWSSEVDRLADKIVGANAEAEQRDLARHVAEAQIDIMRVRRARHDLIARAMADVDYRSPGTPQKPIARLVRAVKKFGISVPIPPVLCERLPSKVPEGPGKMAVILSDLAQQLAVIDRYERRASSRRKFAIRRLDDALCGATSAWIELP